MKAIDWQQRGGYDSEKVTKEVINGVWEWAGLVSAVW